MKGAYSFRSQMVTAPTNVRSFLWCLFANALNNSPMKWAFQIALLLGSFLVPRPVALRSGPAEQCPSPFETKQPAGQRAAARPLAAAEQSKSLS